MGLLTTSYLGLELNSPLVVSPSPLSRMASNVRRMQEAGAGAIVLHSLFEEQITRSDYGRVYLKRDYEDAEELTEYFPDPNENAYILSPSGYTAYIRQLKDVVDIPVIGSLNGFTDENWVRYAELIERAGADALELNMYFIANEPQVTGTQVEGMYLELVEAIRQRISIPLAVKLSPYFSATAHMARQLAASGVDALVIFNRFYQPDIDLESMTIVPSLRLSDASELKLRLRWAAILYGQIQADLAITGGVHTAEDVLKSIMAGANVAMMTSALMMNGINYLRQVNANLKSWLEASGVDSLEEIRGRLSLPNSPDSAALERANYMTVLKSQQL